MTLLQEVREVLPDRRMTWTEAFVFAERQARLFLDRQHVRQAPVPTSVMSELPFVQVAIRTPMHSSGATRWMKPRWVVLINGAEPPLRQRFSMAHELKHILDHEYAKRFFPRLMTPDDRRRVEQLCDYFAGCLLMPRSWVREAVKDFGADPVGLAELFQVSPQAMQVRLTQLGLMTPYQRCSGIDNLYLRQSPVLPLELAA